MDCLVHGVTKSQTRLSDFHFHYFHYKCQRIFLTSSEERLLSSDDKVWTILSLPKSQKIKLWRIHWQISVKNKVPRYWAYFVKWQIVCLLCALLLYTKCLTHTSYYCHSSSYYKRKRCKRFPRSDTHLYLKHWMSIFKFILLNKSTDVAYWKAETLLCQQRFV